MERRGRTFKWVREGKWGSIWLRRSKYEWRKGAHNLIKRVTKLKKMTYHKVMWEKLKLDLN